jgi:hypothetical protein
LGIRRRRDGVEGYLCYETAFLALKEMDPKAHTHTHTHTHTYVFFKNAPTLIEMVSRMLEKKSVGDK